MWQGTFIGICQENVSLNEVKSGITMCQKVCLKMKIQTLVGLKCVNRSWKWGEETVLGERRQEEKSCESIIVTIPEDERVRAREDEKVQKYQNLGSDVTGMFAVKTRGIIGKISLKGEEEALIWRCIFFVIKRKECDLHKYTKELLHSQKLLKIIQKTYYWLLLLFLVSVHSFAQSWATQSSLDSKTAPGP